MKLYLDTSVVSIELFGGFSEREKERYPQVVALFDATNSGRTDAIVSLYTMQEVYGLCRQICSENEIEFFVREVFYELLDNRIGIAGLLTREQRLIHRRKFVIHDPSDEPHIITAVLSGCDGIVTYDSHFDAVRNRIQVYTPEEALRVLHGTP